MLRHQSIATIDKPEFINLQPLDKSPLISKCDIKVFYLGENRNRTFINKDVAIEMAKTLPGCPIVGYYKKDAEDFGDHGHRVVIDDEGVKFENLTTPYGFVPTDAKVWFQKFTETTPIGEQIEREYLMTEGYLWTGQFKEAKQVLDDGGKGQSMELGDEVQGEWFTKDNGIDLFIINDAVISKLCILGDNVEPCFEGSSVTKSYSRMEDFAMQLYSMMGELKEALSKGGQETMSNQVDEPKKEFTAETPIEEPVTEPTADFTEEGAQKVDPEPTSDSEPAQDFEKKDEDEEDKKDDNKSDDTEDTSDDDKKDEDDKKKYQLLEEELTALRSEYTALEEKYKELVEYKNQAEAKEKDELIATFYFLTDEEKAEVIAHKNEYSLEQIEEKLSVIAVRNKVDFSLGKDEEEKENIPAMTYNLNSDIDDSVPAWIKCAQGFKA